MDEQTRETNEDGEQKSPKFWQAGWQSSWVAGRYGRPLTRTDLLGMLAGMIFGLALAIHKFGW